jgi:hypothetical protein
MTTEVTATYFPIPIVEQTRIPHPMMATWTAMEVMCISAIETIQTIQGIIWWMTVEYMKSLVKPCNKKNQLNKVEGKAI